MDTDILEGASLLIFNIPCIHQLEEKYWTENSQFMLKKYLRKEHFLSLAKKI